MPTYEYRCPGGHAFEKFQKMAEKPKAKCPTCGLPATRQISGGAGLVFKGSGFYITDYGKDGKGPRKESSEAPATSTKEPAKTGASPEAPAKAAKPEPSSTPTKIDKPAKAAE